MSDTSAKFQGLRTVIYGVPDPLSAKEWYSKAFGTEPYFDEPFYIGFNIGGFELGLAHIEVARQFSRGALLAGLVKPLVHPKRLVAGVQGVGLFFGHARHVAHAGLRRMFEYRGVGII